MGGYVQGMRKELGHLGFFFVALLPFYSPVLSINRSDALLPFIINVTFTRMVFKGFLFHPSKHEMKQFKVHTLTFTYAIIIGSNFSFPLPRTLELTLVSSSKSCSTKSAEKS